MSVNQESRTEMRVTETYTYEVHLGAIPDIRFLHSDGSIRIILPYDGRKLTDSDSHRDEITLGSLKVLSPDASEEDSLSITLMTSAKLPTYLKSGKQMVWSAAYQVPDPQETLLSVEGEIFDGFINRFDRSAQLALSNNDSFANQLQLSLRVWVPDLFVAAGSDGGLELRELLLQQEHAQQIFMAGVADLETLAKHLVALANSGGGRILIGVDAQGTIKGLPKRIADDDLEAIKLALIKAALMCDPPVPIPAPYDLRTKDAVVVRVEVPVKRGEDHSLKGMTYQRLGTRTIPGESATPATADQAHGPRATPVNGVSQDRSRHISMIKDLLQHGSSDDVILIDAFQSISALELGPAISGLINAGRRSGLIVVQNLPAAAQRRWVLAGGNRDIRQQLEARLQEELERCIPQPAAPVMEVIRIDDQDIAVIHVANVNAPVVLYNDLAYDWQNALRRQLSLDEIFSRFLQRVGTDEQIKRSSGNVQLEYGQLNRPIAPPPVAKDAGQDCRYEIQHQAMIWRNTAFQSQPRKDGLQCLLVAPLYQALMHVDPNGIQSEAEPSLTGLLRINFDNVLASRLDLRLQPNHELLQNVSIIKRTTFVVRLTVEAAELFKRRRRMAVLRFRLLDVLLDQVTLDTLQQVCADIGFRVTNVEQARSSGVATLHAIRNKDFCDITLMLRVTELRTPLTRELRYVERTDTKEMDTGVLDLRVLISGSGELASQITALQLQLHQMIRQRFSYLHAA